MELVEAISCFASFCFFCLFVYLFPSLVFASLSCTPFPIRSVNSFFLDFLYLSDKLPFWRRHWRLGLSASTVYSIILSAPILQQIPFCFPQK